jgi:hypothetical protein
MSLTIRWAKKFINAPDNLPHCKRAKKSFHRMMMLDNCDRAFDDLAGRKRYILSVHMANFGIGYNVKKYTRKQINGIYDSRRSVLIRERQRYE